LRGLLALAPAAMDEWKNGTARGEESTPMIQPLRKTHRVIFLVLAVLLPVLFLSGIAFRRSWTGIKPDQAPPECPRP